MSIRETLRIAPTSFAFTALLGFFAALPAFSIDLSAPTLPILPAALNTSWTLAGLTLSLFMVGFAIGQFSAGRLSDSTGRRPVLLSGLACFTLSGAACTCASSGEALAIFRAIQGFGAGACAVIAFAMVQDLFEGDAARAKRSYVTAIFCAVPILAPALGARLTDYLGWRSVHAVLAIIGALLFCVTWPCIAESRSAVRRAERESTRLMIPPLWTDAAFFRTAVANALSYGAIFAYIAGSPTVIIEKLGHSSNVFAAVFACTAIALTAGAWVSGKLGRLLAPPLAQVGLALLTTFCATIALAGTGLSHVPPATVLVLLLVVVMFARGIIAPNMQHIAIERQREQAGLASAVVGISQLLTGALASAIVAALIPFFGVTAVAVPMMVFAGAALVVWRIPLPREVRDASPTLNLRSR